MSFQDWKEVTIRGKSNTVKNVKQSQDKLHSSIQKKVSNSEQSILERKLNDDDGMPVVTMVPHSYKLAFIKARTSKSKTQDQLAKEAKNLKGGVKSIKDLEAGKLTFSEAKKVAQSCFHVIGKITA